MSVLWLNNIYFSYNSQLIFSDLNLTLEKGEFVFLIGKTGSGKSTLLQMIYFNLLPQSGEVQFDRFNSRIIKNSELPLLRRKLGIIFQDFKLLNDRNIYDNLAFVLQAVNTPAKTIKRKVAAALTDVGLYHRRFSYPRELSGGEKQRIAIARSVINDPILILADEPTGNLDPETSNEIVELLLKINSRGTAVIFATHDYEVVKRYKKEIYLIDNGKLVKAVRRQNT